jgi:hypothetical protein
MLTTGLTALQGLELIDRLLMVPIPEAHLLTVFIWKAIRRFSFDGCLIYLPHLHTSGNIGHENLDDWVRPGQISEARVAQ